MSKRNIQSSEVLLNSIIMKNYIITIICVLCLVSCGEPSKPVGMSPRIFRNTPAWNAVKAIMKDDTCKLDKELRKNPELKTLVDPYYGSTILHMAILNNKIKSTEKLLKFGFDPNFIDDSLNWTRTNAVIEAVKYVSVSPKILELVLKYGGDPNSFQEYQKCGNEIIEFNKPAISFAAANSLDKVRLLVEYGAQVNPPKGVTPVKMAASLNIEVLLFLLEHGADYNEHFEAINDSVEYKTVADRIRCFIFPLDSKEYQCKLKVIDFLKKRGQDYYKTKIPKHTLRLIKDQYPETWEEYIKVY